MKLVIISTFNVWSSFVHVARTTLFSDFTRRSEGKDVGNLKTVKRVERVRHEKFSGLS